MLVDLRKLGDGADNRSRTYDLRITNALLYQLSYIGPEKGVFTRVNHGIEGLKLTGRCVNSLATQPAILHRSTLITHESYHRQSRSTYRW